MKIRSNASRNTILDEDDHKFVLDGIHVLECKGYLIGAVGRVTRTLSYPSAFFDKSHEVFYVSDRGEKFKRQNDVYFTVYNDWRERLRPEMLRTLLRGEN